MDEQELVRKFFQTYPKVARKLKNIKRAKKKKETVELLQAVVKIMNTLVRRIPR